MSEDEAVAQMCADECEEVLGPQSCARAGRECELRKPKPPLRVREVRWSAEAVLSVRELTGDDDWWPLAGAGVPVREE